MHPNTKPLPRCLLSPRVSWMRSGLPAGSEAPHPPHVRLACVDNPGNASANAQPSACSEFCVMLVIGNNALRRAAVRNFTGGQADGAAPRPGFEEFRAAE